MTIHKEGYKLITGAFILLLLLSLLIYRIFNSIPLIYVPFSVAAFVFWLFIVCFFRSPKRIAEQNINHIIAPADGKIVVIEETTENEYFNEKRLQISIFMSPMNVHVNRYPVSGKVKYFKYHEGDYLVAWHPKSSTHNERTTVVIEAINGIELLIRQIAGAVARRVVCYSKVDENVIQGEQLGFIKFGSRVDIFLPLNTKINVKLNQKVSANKTIIAQFN